MSGIAGYFQKKIGINESDKINMLNEKLTAMRNCIDAEIPLTGFYKGHYATIIFSGNIYNTNELVSLINSKNVKLQTPNNNELVLMCYLVFGKSIFKDINGSYSFAIYDNEQLILVRDHFGTKPLFYSIYKDCVVFASQQKALFAFGVKNEISKNSWQEIIGLGPAHTLGNGIFKDVNEVLPGCYITAHFDEKGLIRIKKSCFWSLKCKPHSENYLTTIDHTKYLLKDSVTRQMISDKPICTLLSGGLDSSLVSAIVAKELCDEPLTTYSFDFKGNEKNFKSNSFQSSLDRPYVDIMVDYIKSNHNYLDCDNLSQIEGLYKAVDARGVPCMADIESSILYFCSLVSKKSKIALTGECADEIFGGYPWFHREELLYSDTFPWSRDLNTRTYLFKDDFISELDLDNYVKDAYDTSINQLDTSILDEFYDSKEIKIRKTFWLTIRWFMTTLLNRMDRASDYSDLDARVPFADYRLMEYVFNVPWDFKCKNGQVKNLLIECGKDYLPKEVLYRKKSPYPKTYDPYYEQLLGQMLLEEYETNKNLKEIVDKSRLEKFIASTKDYGKPWYGQLMAGPQMLAYVLQIGYWLNKNNYHTN